MAVMEIDVHELVASLDNALVVDVRSPAEHSHARIPGAVGLPLFTDSQRAEIGTLYKQQGRNDAMLHALNYYSPNMKSVIGGLEQELNERKRQGGDPRIVTHCWRGGMRSGVACWMRDLFGYRVARLDGGYKSYRHWTLEQLERGYHAAILGGRTGSAKTEVLHALQESGERTVDLEGLAHHRGSAFGGIGQPLPPSQEQFENELALRLFQGPAHQDVWLEDESQRLGIVNIPNGIWKQMREAKVYYLEMPFELRLERLVDTYGRFSINDLVEGTSRIRKKLGGLQAQQAIEHLTQNNLRDAFRILLTHYDKAYDEATAKRDPKKIIRITTHTGDPDHNAKLVLQAFQQ